MRRPIQLNVRLNRTAAAALLLTGMALGALLLSIAQSAQHGDGREEVRISARQLPDGRVEVGLQQRSGHGQWSERQLPSARFLPIDPGPRWRNSSPLMLGPKQALPGEMNQSAQTEEATNDTGARPSDGSLRVPTPGDVSICWVAHGAPGDPFWRTALNFASAFGEDGLGFTDLQVASVASTEEQAAIIRECAMNGANVIATTLADPEGLREALAFARSKGAAITTFNSGGDYAASVRAVLHASINDRKAGAQLGERLESRGVTGKVLCVLHEANNVGLQDRCDGLDDSYNAGEVVPLDAGATGVTDISGTAAAIAAELDKGGYAAAVTLNQALAGELVQAAAQVESATGSDIVTASFGSDQRLLELVLRGQLDYFILDQALLQGYQAVVNAYLTHALSVLLDLDRSPTVLIEIGTIIFDRDNALRVLVESEPRRE